MGQFDDIAVHGYYVNQPFIEESTFTKNAQIVASCSFWNKNFEMVMNKLLTNFLNHLNRLDLKDLIYTVLKENILNGIKANMKRYYFKKLGLKNENDTEYEQAMEGFKHHMISHIDEYQTALIREQWAVTSVITWDSKKIVLSIINDAVLKQQEYLRIAERIKKAEAINDQTEIFTMDMDETEGAGMGLLLMACLLKSEGLSISNYSIRSYDNKTEAQLTIPLITLQKSFKNLRVTEKIINHIDSMPIFERHLLKVMELVDVAENTINDIAAVVRKDIFLTAKILQFANSEFFLQSHKVDTIEKAIHLIGKRAFREYLNTFEILKENDDKYHLFEELLNDSLQAVFIAKEIGKKWYYDLPDLEMVELGALLQNLGSIAIYSLEPKILKSIGKIVDEKQIPASVRLEEVMLGVNHVAVGTMITRMWNFPEFIPQIIEFHHNPYLVDPKYKKILYPIYLADMIIDFNRGSSCIYQMEPDIMDFFRITLDDITDLAIRMEQKYYSTQHESSHHS